MTQPDEDENLDEVVEDETYIPSPKAPPHGKGKGLVTGSGGSMG
jgi:hypothetical protein